jgi:DUF971 family protein
MASAWPLDIQLHETSGRVDLLWSDGLRACLSGQQLRLACRCATCESLRRAGQAVAVGPDAAVSQLRPVGDIGLQIIFTDGHDRGIYPWPYLHQLSMP